MHWKAGSVDIQQSVIVGLHYIISNYFQVMAPKNLPAGNPYNLIYFLSDLIGVMADTFYNLVPVLYGSDELQTLFIDRPRPSCKGVIVDTGWANSHPGCMKPLATLTL